jgi:hypothetical protein
MKMKTAAKICIAYCIVPWLQHMLSLVVRAAGRLSGVLDDWAWSTARGLVHDPCPKGCKGRWKEYD